MATSSRSTSAARKKTTTRKGSTKKNTTRKTTRGKKQPEKNSGIRQEIIILCILAISIVLLVSNFGIGGIVGNYVSACSFGILGLVSYAFPFILFFVVAFYISNKNNPLVYRKIGGGIGCIIFLSGFMQLLTLGYSKSSGILAYYSICAEEKIGGGIIGALQVQLCGKAFGTVGAYAIIIIALMISAIIMTQRPLLAPIAESGSRAYQSAAENRKMRKELIQEQQEAKEAELSKNGRTKRTKPAKKEQRAEKELVDFPLTSDTLSASEQPDKKTALDHVPYPETDPMQAIAEIIPDIIPEDIPEEELFAAPVKDIMKPETMPTQEDIKEKRHNPRSSRQEINDSVSNIQNEISTKSQDEEVVEKEYQFPPLSLLGKGKKSSARNSVKEQRATALKLQQTLKNFGVNVTISDVSCGPSVTRYELQPEQGVKVSRIVNLADDIKLNLAAADIRIEAPIPGKAAVGIEVPNETNSAVRLRELLETDEFQEYPSPIAFAVGKDIAGKPVIADIARMPHVLIAGATGSGKSVCINTLIMSILYKADPKDVKLIMIDPKVVELSIYNGIPHLYIPVVTDPKKAAGALNWAVAEMTDRYNKFAEYNVRDLKGYNAKVDSIKDIEDEDKPKKMPQIVIIVDELADLMMVAPGEVEDAICRLAQLARAAGIHLIIATQRPSVNVITGLIKANMPSRIAFSVSSGVDSRTILDMHGAEKLLGKGDMLFYPQGYQKPARVQGSFVSDKEVGDVVNFLSKAGNEPSYDTEIAEKINNCAATSAPGGASAASSDLDDNFIQAGKFIIEKDKASIGMLQRVFKIGFNRAARIMDQLAKAGVVGAEEGTKPRKVLMSMEEFEKYIEESL